MIMAILMFVAGIILSTIRVKDKQDFEYKIQQIQVMHKIVERNEELYNNGIQEIMEQLT